MKQDMKQGWIQVTHDGVQENLAPKTTADAVYTDASLTSTVQEALLAHGTVAQYTHTRQGRVHNFAGEGSVGWARVTAAFQPGDTFAVNGLAVDAYVQDEDRRLECLAPGRVVMFMRSVNEISFVSNGPWVKMRKTEVYGVRIDKTNPNPATRCTYLMDAVGKRPAKMIYGTESKFDYGDWADVGFVRDNRPVMLRSNGTVDYALNPSDVSRRIGGSLSDVDNTAYDGNAMSEMPLWWLKQYEDASFQYIFVSNCQYDNDFHAYAFTRADGTVATHLYLPMYTGSYSESKLRSLSGQAPMASQTASTETTRAVANGERWHTKSWAQVDYVNALLTLISCSTDSQTAFGRGYTGQTAALKTGTLNASDQFFGDDVGKARVKVFWCEDWWGNLWDRIAGMVAKSSRIWVKMTPPYDLAGANYIDSGVTPTGTSSGYQSEQYFSQYGKIPKVASGSATTYYADCMWWAATAHAMVGGQYANTTQAGAFSLSLNQANTVTNAAYGASLSALPPPPAAAL